MARAPPFGAATEASGFPRRRGASRSRRWLEVRWGSRVFLPCVHLVLQVLVPVMASGYSLFVSDMPTGGGIRRDFRTKKKGLLSLTGIPAFNRDSARVYVGYHNKE